MPDERGLNFMEFLQGFRRGEVLHAANDEMQALVAAVVATGGKGKMVLTLNVSLNKAGQLEFTPAVESKRPRPALGIGIFYGTEDGDLLRRDPNQIDMFGDELRDRRAAQDD